MPLAAERLPAFDIGLPYLARFSGVSATGALEVTLGSPALRPAWASDDIEDTGVADEVSTAAVAADGVVRAPSTVAPIAALSMGAASGVGGAVWGAAAGAVVETSAVAEVSVAAAA